MDKEQIELAVRVLNNWKNSTDVMNGVGRSLGYDVIDTAIFSLTESLKTIGKAWTMYENKGEICPDCIEHICDGWNYCPECGKELNKAN